MNTKIIIPVESIHPFFEWDADSKEIMEKDMGFVITHFSMQITKENWLIVNASWKLNDEKDRGYLIKYPRFNGHSSTYGGGTDEVAVNFFFPEIEADEEALRFDYDEKERRYNGFGKVGFSIGIEVEEEEFKKYKWPVLGYEYAYSQNAKYGVSVYFNPRDFGEIERTLVEYDEDDLLENTENSEEKA
jgi:hypothetical protein